MKRRTRPKKRAGSVELRRPSPDHAAPQRGFAMIIVMIFVSLLAIVSATLLNLVSIDLTIVGQNRKITEARAVADGASFEVIQKCEENADLCLPSFATNNLQVVLLDKNNLFGSGAVNSSVLPGTSYYDKAKTTSNPDETFAADVRLTGYGPIKDCSQAKCRAIFYEGRTIGDIDSGSSTSEVRTELWQVTTRDEGWIGPRWHGR